MPYWLLMGVEFNLFGDLIRALGKLKQPRSIPISVEIDDKGYWDRQCPRPDCGFHFKVLLDDWKAKVSEEAAFCPFCGHQERPTEFNTPEQQAYFQQIAVADVQQRLNQALQEAVRDMNPHRIRLEEGSPPLVIALPPAAEEEMTLQIVCELCACHFAVIGAAYFCPACGYNSAGHTFLQSLGVARATIGSLPTITAAISDQNIAAQIARNLTESGLGNLVTAFQRWAEAEYSHLPNPVAVPRRNAFQNLVDGSRLWVAAGGTAYATILEANEMAHLNLLFQQRHVLAHREGIVDQDYVTRSGDSSYTVGQRLVVHEQAVLELAGLLERLVSGLRKDLREHP